MANDENTANPPRAKGDRFYREVRRREAANKRQPPRYVIWSEEHGRWWRGRGNWGYTTSLLAAGRYGQDEAWQIADDANRFSETVKEVALPDPLSPDFAAALRLGMTTMPNGATQVLISLGLLATAVDRLMIDVQAMELPERQAAARNLAPGLDQIAQVVTAIRTFFDQAVQLPPVEET